MRIIRRKHFSWFLLSKHQGLRYTCRSYSQEETSKCHNWKFHEVSNSPWRQYMFTFFFLKVAQEKGAGVSWETLPARLTVLSWLLHYKSMGLASSEMHWHWRECWPVTNKKWLPVKRTGLDKVLYASLRTGRSLKLRHHSSQAPSRCFTGIISFSWLPTPPQANEVGVVARSLHATSHRLPPWPCRGLPLCDIHQYSLPCASTLPSPPLREQQSFLMRTKYSKCCSWTLHWALDSHSRALEGKTSAIRSEHAERERRISEAESVQDSVQLVYTADSGVWKNSVTVKSSLEYGRKSMNLKSRWTWVKIPTLPLISWRP